MNIFIAGATGVIGRLLVPMALAAGHTVVGMTRSPAKAAALDALGAKGVVADAFDAAHLREVVAAARPDVVIHQLTDLPQRLDPERAAEALERNSRLRIEATPNLVEAARAAGARRLIAQSIAFAYALGPAPLRESDRLGIGADGVRGMVVRGVVALETAVMGAAGMHGIVLRYGRFYGPGTWYATPGDKPGLHVEAAAHAALLALTRGAPGIYNIADDDGAVAIDKARQELGFDPAFRLSTPAI